MWLDEKEGGGDLAQILLFGDILFAYISVCYVK